MIFLIFFILNEFESLSIHTKILNNCKYWNKMAFSTPVQKFSDFYNSKNMNKKTFYQRSQASIIRSPKPLRSCKLSMDDMTSLMSRQGSELKKRNSNGPIEILKLERSSFKKSKLNSNASMASSIFASRSNSPIKFGLQKQ